MEMFALFQLQKIKLEKVRKQFCSCQSRPRIFGSVNYAERGIKVSCLCPQGVRTPMLLGPTGDRKSFLSEGSVSAEDVAGKVMETIEAERFLVLPHPEVADYEQRKAKDRDRWLSGMRRLRQAILTDPKMRGLD